MAHLSSRAGRSGGRRTAAEVTVGPGDDASTSLSELAAAEASELDAVLAFGVVFCFLVDR